MSWRECTLGDVVKLQRGHDLPERVRIDGPVPIVSSSGITGRHNIAKADPPGVVTGRYGTIGEVFFVDEPYWPLNTALYVVDFKGNDPRFTAYLLRNILKNYKSEKAAVPGVDRNVLHLLKVRTTERRQQERVVSFLSAYDDLIENNRRRIALLEEAARMLYREWFVHFRFPGHEHDKIIDGLPEGWELRSVGELAELKGGKQMENDLIATTGDIPVFGGNGIQGFSDEKTHDGFVIAFGRVGAYCSSVHWSYRGAWINNNASSLVPYDHQELVLHHLLGCDFTNFRKGAAQPFIPNGVLSTIVFKMPPKSLARMFCEYARDYRFQQVNLNLQNQKLAQARDLLLPRLMNGEIAV